MKLYEKEDQKIRITQLEIKYKVVPFSDALWKTVLKKWRDILNIEEVVLSVKENRYSDTFTSLNIEAYTDTELIERLGLQETNEIVLERISDYLQEHYKLDEEGAKTLVTRLSAGGIVESRRFYVGDIVKE